MKSAKDVVEFLANDAKDAVEGLADKTQKVIENSATPDKLQKALKGLKRERKIPKIIPMEENHLKRDEVKAHEKKITKSNIVSANFNMKKWKLPKMSEVKIEHPAATQIKESEQDEIINNSIKREDLETGNKKTEPAEDLAKPTKQNFKRKHKKKRKLKDTLPCNLDKIYILKAGTLSKKEFYEQCTSKKVKCKRKIKCQVHEGRDNLRKLRTLIKNIKPNHPGWKMGIKWNITIGGSIETLLNFKYLRDDLLKTKKRVADFNESRAQLQTYKKTINQLLKKAKEKQQQTINNKLSQTKPQPNQTKHKISYNSTKSSPIELKFCMQPQKTKSHLFLNQT